MPHPTLRWLTRSLRRRSDRTKSIRMTHVAEKIHSHVTPNVGRCTVRTMINRTNNSKDKLKGNIVDEMVAINSKSLPRMYQRSSSTVKVLLLNKHFYFPRFIMCTNLFETLLILSTECQFYSKVLFVNHAFPEWVNWAWTYCNDFFCKTSLDWRWFIELKDNSSPVPVGRYVFFI